MENTHTENLTFGELVVLITNTFDLDDEICPLQHVSEVTEK
jgi:hypothetical protein